MPRLILRAPAAALAALLLVGCPHRSPVWSPGGTRLVVLSGKGAEEVDKAASQLWLVEPEGGKATELVCPEKGVRYLAATWLDDASLAVFTGKWEGGFVEAGSEKTWRLALDGQRWEALKLPPPGETNATRRPPVVIGAGDSQAIAYPHDAEAVVVVEIATGKVLAKHDPAELVGPGPQGGLLVSRPQPEDAGTIEIAALGADLKVIWRQKLSALRAGIAARLGKAPVDIVFNTTSTSELPRGGEAGWVGLTVIFSDVGWKEGIPGYHVKLDDRTGEVQQAVRGVGVSGRPGIARGVLWSVLAPEAKENLPLRVQSFEVAGGKPSSTLALPDVAREHAFGYALDPAGKRLAVSTGGAAPAVRVHALDALDKPRVIALEASAP